MKFKIGDKVGVKQHRFKEFIYTGIIKRVDNGNSMYLIMPDSDQYTRWEYEKEVELIEEKKEMKFKSNDGVRITNITAKDYNKTGLVEYFDKSKNKYRIIFGLYRIEYYYENELELIKENYMFKVGDTVKVICREFHSYNKIGIIKNMYYNSDVSRWCYTIVFKDGDEGENYRTSDLKLIEEKKEMKFKIGDIVQINNYNYGTIESYNKEENTYTVIIHTVHHRQPKPADLQRQICSEDMLSLYILGDKGMTTKKYITLADIKKHNPCNSNEYIALLERHGNNFKITYEDLIGEFYNQKSWIEQNLSEFKEQPVYNGRFKVGDTVYVDNGIGVYKKGKVTDITYGYYWLIEVTAHYKDIYNYPENRVYFSLSELKKYWHHQITAIKDIEEEIRCCNTCKKSYKNSGKECTCDTTCENYSKWESIEEKNCSNCEHYGNDFACEDFKQGKVKECKNWKPIIEKSCKNCGNANNSLWCSVLKAHICEMSGREFWKPKEK